MTSVNDADSNVALIKEAYTRYWNNEFDAFFDLFVEDFEWIVSDGFPYGGNYQGREEVMDGVFSHIQADWATFTHELDRFIDGGDTIVPIGRYEGTHETTGAAVTAPMVHVFDIEGEKIQRFQQFTDTAVFQAALPADERTVLE
jgi:ketosteroid isomerase-like protein